MADDVRCRVIVVDGQPVRVRGAKPTTAEDQAALTEVIRAARAKAATMPPAPISVECPDCGAPPGALCRVPFGDGHTRAGRAHQARRDAVEHA